MPEQEAGLKRGRSTYISLAIIKWLKSDMRFLEVIPKVSLFRSKGKMMTKQQKLKKHNSVVKIRKCWPLTLTCIIFISDLKIAWLSLKISKSDVNCLAFSSRTHFKITPLEISSIIFVQVKMKLT